ncbi:MAG: hypothetical protein ACK4R6_01155 [Spirosomataceae bacterium]
MKYHRNLLAPPQKSTAQTLLGIFSLIFAVAWPVFRILDGEPIRLSDWVYAAFFFISGIVYTLSGLGKSVETFFGEAFIHLDAHCIRLKLSVFKKETRINWEDIQSITYEPTLLRIHINDNSTRVFGVSTLDFSYLQDLKKVLAEMAVEKQVMYRMK